MLKDIPTKSFNSSSKQHSSFEIVSIDSIIQRQKKISNSSELPHQLQFHMLIFYTEGVGRHYIDFKWYPVQENSLIYISKGQVHAFDFSTNLNGFCIIFTDDYLVNRSVDISVEFKLSDPQIVSPIIKIPKDSSFINYFNLLQSEFCNPNPVGQKGIIGSLFIILFLKTESFKQNQSYYLENSSFFETYQNFSALVSSNISKTRNASDYAEELAITYKHLNTICKKIAKKTAKKVIDDFVILQAKRNLTHTSLSILEIAYKFGFESSTNFSKFFKKHTGLTPKSFMLSVNNLTG